MTMFISIISMIFILAISVIVHETGHFLVAKKFNYSIEEFSIGMGPKILQKEKNGITYSLRALPLGGYVRFPETVNDGKRNFNAPSLSKFLVAIMGVVFNILLAILLLLIVFLLYGNNFFEALVKTANGMAAAFDSIIQSFYIFFDINSYGSVISATTLTNQIISNSSSITETIIDILAIGWSINIGLAIINLFPLPILDGGQIIINAIELIMRKPIPTKIKDNIGRVCGILLILFACFIYVRDILNL